MSDSTDPREPADPDDLPELTDAELVQPRRGGGPSRADDLPELSDEHLVTPPRPPEPKDQPTVQPKPTAAQPTVARPAAAKPIPAKPVARPAAPRAPVEPPARPAVSKPAGPQPVAAKPIAPAPMTPVQRAVAPRPVTKTARPAAALIEEQPAAAVDPASTQPRSGPSAPPLAEGERPPLRVLDKAPLHLRTAAMVAVAGCLLPWMGHSGGPVTVVLAKLVVLVGVWCWYKQAENNWGPQLQGFLGKLANLELIPKSKEAKEKEAKQAERRAKAGQGGPTALEHPFPTGLHVLSLVLIVVGCVVIPLLDPSESIKQMTGLGMPGYTVAMAELGMLAWAAFTWVHIYSYERWGSFSPIFPLMFLAMVFAGAMRVLAGFGSEVTGLDKLASIAGGGIVAVGGMMAAYTIVEAMMQAKKQGDAKKEAQMEARRAARRSRKDAQPGS